MKWLNDERIKMNEGKKKIHWFIEWRMKKKWKKKKQLMNWLNDERIKMNEEGKKSDWLNDDWIQKSERRKKIQGLSE